MPRPVVSIVVPTLNTPRMTQACLEAVTRNTGVRYELIVINNSRSSEIRHCLSGFRALRVVQNGGNVGYTRAANQGIRHARGEFLCFLNTDALVPRGWVERLLEVVRRQGVGAAGPLSQRVGYRYDQIRGDWASRQALTGLMDETLQRWNPGSLQEVTILTGFCWMIPRSVLEEVGWFDERFFFGYEDFDYSLRLRLSGYRLYQIRYLFVHHQMSGSTPCQIRRRLARKAEKLFAAKWSRIVGRRLHGWPSVVQAVERRWPIPHQPARNR